MENINILLSAMLAGFAVTFGFLKMMWKDLNKRMDGVETKIDKLDEKLSKRIDEVDAKLTNRIDKLDEKLTDVDRRLCRLEGAFSSKDCCMIKDDRQIKKAE